VLPPFNQSMQDFSFLFPYRNHELVLTNEPDLVDSIRIVQLQVSLQLHFAQPDVNPFSLFPKKKRVVGF